MIKMIGFLCLFTSLAAFGQKCKVYGISDSPQLLNCAFPKQVRVTLSCERGKYLLNGKPVEMAFHAEVEEGACPLIFKLKDSTLTVIPVNSFYTAELETEDGLAEGQCH